MNMIMYGRPSESSASKTLGELEMVFKRQHVIISAFGHNNPIQASVPID